MKTILVLEGGCGADTGQTWPAEISTETYITEYDEKENVWFVIGGDRVRHDFDDAEMALAFVQQTLREQQEAVHMNRPLLEATGIRAAKRELVIDTETTGTFTGDRIVELGAVELFEGVPTGQIYHAYLNPGCAIHPMAQAIHGLTEAELAGKPSFVEIADDFLAFVDNAKLVAHNVAFDMERLNEEFAAINYPIMPRKQFFCTLRLAQAMFPAPNTLDALGNRYRFIEGFRTTHNAIDDCYLTAKVYARLLARDEGSDLSDAFLAENRARAASPPVARSKKITPTEGVSGGRYAGQTITFTGDLQIARSEAVERAALAGFKVANGVSRSVDVVVVGTQDLRILNGYAKSGKHRKAEALIADGCAIRIVDERTFFALIDSKAPPEPAL